MAGNLCVLGCKSMKRGDLHSASWLRSTSSAPWGYGIRYRIACAACKSGIMGTAAIPSLKNKAFSCTSCTPCTREACSASENRYNLNGQHEPDVFDEEVA